MIETVKKYRKATRGRKVTVLGAARSGLAVARLLEKHGADVLISEMQPLNQVEEAARQLTFWGLDAEWEGHSDKALSRDWLVISPGVPIDSPVVRKAQANGMLILGELEVASWYLDIPMIAVTGSNGKTTTTTLITEMLCSSNVSAVACGNIGRPLAEIAFDATAYKIAVVEVSSFQMETAYTFHPHVALFLNLTPDHLDRHGNMEIYGELKARVFKHQNPDDWAIYNQSDDHVMMLMDDLEAKRLPFDVKPLPADGAYVEQGRIKLRFDCREYDLLATDEMRLRGQHNVLNALASSLASMATGANVEGIVSALKTFEGLTHRMESVGHVNGVEYINDSKATNVDAVWYALGGFNCPIILIAGGRDKDSDFTLLSDRIRDNVKNLILIGEAADKMAVDFEGLVPVHRAQSLQDAVEQAVSFSDIGDVVLFSPACSSFDMFRNYEDRGNKFKEIIEKMGSVAC
ncbi:UDP-N-acetylmuramoyl-L-alanine--D-glutamate ligase [bacterium]|nr:UDP-N-acetylmuramoyl-L-alanine--D-glutamate ligase [bacterium]